MRGRKKPAKEASGKNQRYSRRDFLIAGGTAVAVDALIPGSSAISAETRAVYPASKGYLVYDSKKCAGCTTCMMACSLTHHGGVPRLSL